MISARDGRVLVFGPEDTRAKRNRASDFKLISEADLVLEVLDDGRITINKSRDTRLSTDVIRAIELLQQLVALARHAASYES